MKLFLGRVFLISVLLALWEIASQTIADEFFISRPTIIAQKFVALVASGRLFYHGGITVVETLAGFVLARLQRIPYLGESFEYEGHRYTVEDMDGHRIARVRIEDVQPAAAQAGD